MSVSKPWAGAHAWLACVVVLVAGGCSMHRRDATPAASAGVAAAPGGVAATQNGSGASGGDAGALLSEADRARLATVCAQRALPSASAAVDGYRLGPDDLIEVRIPDLLEAQAPSPVAAAGAGTPGRATVSAAPTFQQGLRVDQSGNVTIATLGTVKVSGLTASEAERDLARRLVRAGILDAPQVSVLVVEHRSRVAAVVGSVERPGVYPITSRETSLADLVWLAGGPTREAGRVVAFTPAPSDGAAAATAAAALESGKASATSGAPIRMDLDLLLHSSEATGCVLDPPARAGDVISVSPAGTVQVAGWVDKPGSVPVTRGLTVTGAIAAVGGNVFAADGQKVIVKRTLAPGEERAWVVDLDAIAEGRAKDVPLTDGDVVTVPSDTTKLVPYGMWSFAKEMIHVGGSIPLF